MIDQDVRTTNEVLESEIELMGHLKTMSEKLVIAKNLCFRVCACFFLFPNDISGKRFFLKKRIQSSQYLIPNGAPKTGVHSKYLKTIRKNYINPSE